VRLTAAIHGDLHKFLKDQRDAAERAVTEGVREITTRIKDELRSQVVGAGLGNKLAKTWQAKVYPARGQNSISAAGVVTSENAPKRGIGNKRISPSTFPESRFGRLRFVRVDSRLSLLVVDSKMKGRPAKVMFMLVPQVQLKKRLDYMTCVDRWAPQLPQAILNNWTSDGATN
jgi:hypothetical protein